MKRQESGFTLIELLIVVAIIAILAAIAVPNFLEAQTRAKVSRVRADMRSMATALEAYTVDWNSYPLCNSFGLPGTRVGDPVADDAVRDRVLERLSTPTAYITNGFLPDPFTTDMYVSFSNVGGVPGTPQPEMVFNGPQWRSILYISWQPLGRTEVPNMSGFGVAGPARSWATYSGGPDRVKIALGGVLANFDADDTQLLIYDPTNGTTSYGDLYRVGGQTGGDLVAPNTPYGGGFGAGVARAQR